MPDNPLHKMFDGLNNANLRIGLCSSGIRKIPHLENLLGLKKAHLVTASNPLDADIFLGWGNKKSGQKARSFAECSGSSFLLLEDAFIRSYAPQSVMAEQSLGLVLDDQGIYYDASRPSRLEVLISKNCNNPSANSNGRKLIEQLSSSQISKYNNFDTDLSRLNLPEKFILVIDQTHQDLSISSAGGDQHSFSHMLDTAICENPNQQVVVKLHPEVMAGKKKGYLKGHAIARGCTLLSDNINPWQLFQFTDKVYTVSSQLGFDAIMAGCKVRCFAMPFYAGWGLTKDEMVCERRSRFKPTIPEIADAALNQYASYICPYNQYQTSALETISNLATIRNAYDQNKTLAAFHKITPWKWHRINKMFRPTAHNRTFFLTSKGVIKAASQRGADVVSWASATDEKLQQSCEKSGVKLQMLEDGFIRSVGLGTNFHQPMSLILDDLGIYYDPNQPSRLEYILENGPFDQYLLDRAAALIELITTSNITKYNLGSKIERVEIYRNRKLILVPGQVDDDASIRLGGKNMTGIELLEMVRKKKPDCTLIFKPHPDVVSGQRCGLSGKENVKHLADHYLENTSITQLIKTCDEVHTISSLAGFEALLRAKPVHCYGMPFYAGWGLTTDTEKCARRTKKLSLGQLVVGTLIKYPRYFDPVSNLPCGPELVIQRICEQLQNPTSPSLLIRARTAFGKLRSQLR